MRSLVAPKELAAAILVVLLFFGIGGIYACAANSGLTSDVRSVSYPSPAEGLDGAYITRVPYALDGSICYVLHNAAKVALSISCIYIAQDVEVEYPR